MAEQHRQDAVDGIEYSTEVLPLLFPEVHNHLLCFVNNECEVIFLTPHSEGPHPHHMR